MNKIRIVILCAIMCISIQQVSAQDFHYEKIQDAPEKVNFLNLGLGIWDMNLAAYNFSLWNFNPQVSLYLNSKLRVDGEFSYALLDRFYPEADSKEFQRDFSQITSIYKATNAAQGSVLATYYFRNNTETTDVRVHLKSSGHVDYVADIPGQVLSSTGVRLGYTAGSSLYSLNNIEMKGKDANMDVTFNESLRATTMIAYSMLKAGISFNSLYDFSIKTDMYGIRKAESMTGWYVDAFVPFNFTLDDVWVHKNTGYSSTSSNQVFIHQVSIDKYNNKLPLGGAIGYYNTNIKGAGVGWGAEAGLLPGLSNALLQNVYVRINCSFQFAIGF
jgi:hypothetical protein